MLAEFIDQRRAISPDLAAERGINLAPSICIGGAPGLAKTEVAKFIVASDDSWIPESFKRGMADAKAGRFADMDAVLSDAPPPSRHRAK